MNGLQRCRCDLFRLAVLAAAALVLILAVAVLPLWLTWMFLATPLESCWPYGAALALYGMAAWSLGGSRGGDGA